MPHAPARTLGLAMVLTLAACAPVSTGSPAPGSAAPTGTAAAGPTVAPTAAGELRGTWAGALVDPSGSYPVLVSLDGCSTTGAVCGEIEYMDPSQGDAVLCASELTLTERDGERLSFSERYVYRGWMCLPTTFAMTPTADGGLDAEQFVEPGVVCCRGTLAARSGPSPTPAVPASLGALGTATAASALGGATTQYAGAGAGSLWFPLEDLGAVARVDPATGAISALVVTGDPGSLAGMRSDPHGVAAGDAGVWVAQAAARAVGRIDPATSMVTDSVPLQVIPYALALDGTTLWVTSFEDDRVLRVDLPTGTIAAEFAVSKPTGIAVGLGGVWVVRHRDDVLVRINPATNKVVAEISLGDSGPSAVCGMCVENVIVGDGGVWTANNYGRSVSRIDPATNKVAATVRLDGRPWAVATGAGRIWASQIEGTPEDDDAFIDLPSWAVAAIDPATNLATSFPFPGALSVFWAEEALWVVQPGRRGDVLVRVEVAGG